MNSSFLNVGVCALSACTVFAAPAAAQSFTGSETHYASVRGWDVLVIHDQSGVFTYCGATKNESGNKVLIALGADGLWGLAVPTYQTGTFGGGVLDIDKVSIDSQFGFVGGFATRDLSLDELHRIKAGNQMGVMINGDGPERWWSLSGSSAAITKVEECVIRRGSAPTATATSQPTVSPTSGFLSPVIPVGEMRIGNCDMVFTGPYRCTFESLPAKQGYRSSTRIVDTFNQAPTLDLDAVSDSEADVWALLDGQWQFMGRWASDQTAGDCLVPTSNQVPEARNNLGQDAWQICVN
ncbi:MAG: hypothetical protein GJ676_15750 [Rhodobacteraceae bacterium]|nr:hypothetical protein [Paracoccaceae bacterium]